MPKKPKTQYVCTSCGALHNKWAGRCDDCGEWSTLEEQAVQDGPVRGLSKSSSAVLLKEVKEESKKRTSTGNAELDRTLGGGLTSGSLVLLGGDPGIGKSTLLLQTTSLFATAGLKALYVTGEESLEQVKQRAERLEVPNAELYLLCETNLTNILAEAEQLKPDILVIDSIQTLFKEDLPGTPGSVNQVRECTLELMVQAKTKHRSTILVGHVTKEGTIAGPRVLEHMVDTVVYFEGERQSQFRVLRTIKNRFGSTHELGVLEMTAKGLLPVENPSQLFLKENREPLPGSLVSCSVEGSRCFLFEIQALVSSSTYAVAQRVALGLDPKKLTILLALLEKFGGVQIGNSDVFVSAVGGLKIQDPATDLAVSVSIASSYLNKALPVQWAALGELGLNGEVRPVQQLEARLNEIVRMGFTHAIVPFMKKMPKVDGLQLHPVLRLDQALEFLDEH